MRDRRSQPGEFARRARLLGAFAGVTLAAVLLIIARVQESGALHDAPAFPSPPRQVVVLGRTASAAQAQPRSRAAAPIAVSSQAIASSRRR